MAYEDWDQIAYGATSSTAILNSSLSNPLTTGGDYCRRIATLSGGQAYAQCGSTLKSTYDGGAFYGVPNNRALRLQAYLRVESTNSAANGFCIGAKMPNNIGSNSLASLASAGYALGLGGSLSVILYTNQSSVTLPDGALGAVSLNTWYGLRMEVFPLGTAGDRIMCYRETTPGSGVWTNIYDEVISAASSRYVAWGTDKKTGFCSFTAQYAGINAYIANVDFSLATAPTPIA